MTPNEAIDYMENEIRCVQRARYCDRDCAKCKLVKEDKPLIEAFGEAIKALEKQIPQKVKYCEKKNDDFLIQGYLVEGRVIKCFECPKCGKHLRKYYNFCPHCSKALDWSDTK